MDESFAHFTHATRGIRIRQFCIVSFGVGGTRLAGFSLVVQRLDFFVDCRKSLIGTLLRGILKFSILCRKKEIGNGDKILTINAVK
jgi:hypothetical protein